MMSGLGRKAVGTLLLSQEEDVWTHSLASLCIVSPSKAALDEVFCPISLVDQQGLTVITVQKKMI